VFSKTLKQATWRNSLLLNGNIAEEMRRIKQQPGKNIWLVGSVSIAQTLMANDLIDEYRLFVNPVLLGEGRALFRTLDAPQSLDLQEVQRFQNGVIGMRYTSRQT
jgi:dihydrofolate reductase